MDTIRAVVQKIIREGKHGVFAVATSSQLTGSVTFSLEPTVWKESDLPEPGALVLLGELRQKRAGWRAKYGRYYRPSDEQTERSSKIQFLYPHSRQFPFDKVCWQIVIALEKRNWEVPGIEVDFHEYGSGEQKFRYVSRIQGLDFKLAFGRIQGSMPGGHWNDTAAVTELVIPGKQINVYDDESGPTFYLYVGDDWERDRKLFMNGSKVNSKLYGKPRLYLRYRGECHCGSQATDPFAGLPHTHTGRRPPLLVHTNDLGREYDLRREPVHFNTDAVMEEYRQYLEEVVLKAIEARPLPGVKADLFAPPESLPVPNDLGSLFCFVEYDDAERIRRGKENPESLDPANRFGLVGNGRRLVGLGIPNDGTVPEIAYEGFLWCGVGKVTTKTKLALLKIPGYTRRPDREKYLVRVIPNRANGIYIADHGQYERRREALIKVAVEAGRDQFTDGEVADFQRARARTIVPVNQYLGGYENPVVLVNRELSLDEVEVING